LDFGFWIEYPENPDLIGDSQLIEVDSCAFDVHGGAGFDIHAGSSFNFTVGGRLDFDFLCV
jgi:hypothetical protein